MKKPLPDWVFRLLYWYISSVDKKGEVLLMNYGYENPDEVIALEERDIPNRYSIQLYHRLASRVELTGKTIAEIGCGRGGGLDYVARTFAPAQAIGIDLNTKAVNFANSHYAHPGLYFKQGNAQSIPLGHSSCDVVLNVESSHRYPDEKGFFHEVWRILKPGGHFLFTDFRYDHQMPAFLEAIAGMGFQTIEEQNINEEVIRALDLDHDRREELVRRLMPRMFQGHALNFAGGVGSKTYLMLKHREFVYFLYILRKP